MTVVELTTDIAAPIERVFDLARDLDLHAASMAHTGERAVAGRMTGRVEAGDTVTWRARHFGMWWSLTSRITEVEAPVRFADVQERGPFAWFRHEHRFEARDGVTRMYDHWEHRSPLGPLGPRRRHAGAWPVHALAARDPQCSAEARGGNDVTTADLRLHVLYDADCGICSRSARLLHRLDHGRRLRLLPLQAAREIPDAPPEDVLLEALHVRDEAGQWNLAGAAWIRIAKELPLLRPVAIAARLAPVRRLIEWAYWRIAGNRHRLSHLLCDDACAIGSRTP